MKSQYKRGSIYTKYRSGLKILGDPDRPGSCRIEQALEDPGESNGKVDPVMEVVAQYEVPQLPLIQSTEVGPLPWE